MNQVLRYLKVEALGGAIDKSVKFSGVLPAAAIRNGHEKTYIAVRWNDDISAPDVVYDPGVSRGRITEITAVYSKGSAPASTDSGSTAGSNPASGEPSEFDLLSVPKIKEELSSEFGLKPAQLNGKKKAELYEMLLELRKEAEELKGEAEELKGEGGGGGNESGHGGSEPNQE